MKKYKPRTSLLADFKKQVAPRNKNVISAKIMPVKIKISTDLKEIKHQQNDIKDSTQKQHIASTKEPPQTKSLTITNVNKDHQQCRNLQKNEYDTNQMQSKEPNLNPKVH